MNMSKTTTLVLIKLVIIALALFQTGCPGTAEIPPTGDIIYDIRGTWSIYAKYGFNVVINGETQLVECMDCTFSGTKTDGTITPQYGKPGTYDVGGESGVQVKFHFYENEANESYQAIMGFLHSNDYMEGTYTESWRANRVENSRQ